MDAYFHPARHILTLRVRMPASEGSMEKFIAGLAAGAMLGALWVANSNKTRSLVQRGQEELKQKMDAYIDEKLAAMDANKQSSAKK